MNYLIIKLILLKKLWYNLNVVCSFKPNKRNNNAVPSLFVENKLLTNLIDVSNGFNQYFIQPRAVTSFA